MGYESWVERDRLMVLDADPGVVAVAAQPMKLSWTDPTGRPVRHVPDFFARRRDGMGVLIDVRPDHLVGPEDAAVFAATGKICAGVGWEYQRVGELAAIWAANLRWLAGYRHPRCARPGPAGVLREVFSDPSPLLVGARAAGDPIAVLPVLFGMLWRGELVCDVRTALLGPSSLVGIAEPAAVAERVS